jgi:hypothetical protein
LICYRRIYHQDLFLIVIMKVVIELLHHLERETVRIESENLLN